MGIKKKTRQKIKKYAEIMAEKSPDYQYKCFLQAYKEADAKTRKLYDAEMDESERFRD